MTDDALERGALALAEGRWAEARSAFETTLATAERAEACSGLASALWWLGDNHAAVERASRAYVLFRRSGDDAGAAWCAIWLAITYKANFANGAAAAGWAGLAERLLTPVEPGPLHGWLAVARAYRMADLELAERLTEEALALGLAAPDVDLELVARAQIGLIKVGRGDTAGGLALIDEAMAAALAGERSTLDTVVYACCDMLSACELAGDLERAAQWCDVADTFVATYGCPFLHAECRIAYGTVLAAKGRWPEAEQELWTGVRATEGACPGLHARALARLARLRLRQGRVEDATRLLGRLGPGAEAEAEAEELLAMAALQLARGEARAAAAKLEHTLDRLARHRAHLADALELLVDAWLAAGEHARADTAAQRLSGLGPAGAEILGGGTPNAASGATPSAESSAVGDRVAALSAATAGRVALAGGDAAAAAAWFERALRSWSRLDEPFEVARSRAELGRAVVAGGVAAAGTEAAVDHLRRALAAFDGLGAASEADRVAATLRQLGIPTRTGTRLAGPLTVREQDVLRLLGAGLSNPEIAERLHVSRKTASHHVSSILAKLNLRNRAEAAAYAVASAGSGGPGGRT